jgi:hypothetical protein
MAMIDFNYDGKVFDMDMVFYAVDILKAGRMIEFPKKDVIGVVMIVFLDIYGNEARIIMDQGKSKKMPKKYKHAAPEK